MKTESKNVSLELSSVKDESINKFILSVRSEFRNYKRGDCIVDPKEIANVLGCHERNSVVKVLIENLSEKS